MKLKLHEKELNVFSVSFGQIEDLIKAVKLDGLEFGNREELKISLIRSFPNTIQDVLPIVLEMFGLEDDDLKNVKIDSLADTVSLILYFALNELSKCFTNNNQKKGSNDAPFFDLLFEVQLSLCEQFPSLNPIELRHEKAKEIFLLIQRLNKSRNESKNKNVSEEHVENDVIRRPARDDSWF